MGLDMYLYLSKYTAKHFNDKNKDNFYPPELKKLEEKHLKYNFLSKQEKYQIGYWRKANAIHNFFIEQCARGEDNCQPVYVEFDKLLDLKERCEKVLNDHSKAKELLPTCCGFFFGSEEYDDWYFQDLEYTADLLNDVIEFIRTNNKERTYWDCYYEASW